MTRLRQTTPSDAPVPLDGTGRLDDEVELGFVSGFFGVRGEVRLHLHNRESTLLAKPHPVVLVSPAGKRHRATLQSRSGAGKRVIGRIGGIQYRDQSEVYKDWRIVVPRADLPDLDEDEFYLSDLEGMPVWIDGEHRGTIRAIHATGPIEVLELDLGDKEPDFVPCKHEVIEIDFEAGVVHVAAEALARS
ncbi:MAG: 16S rRNA processing protein RimM [Proteobacteria bacterium]|nr:16S rRNA processing protein RimM [Pseudomonadota bacterium]